MSRNTDITDYCSVTLETQGREPTDKTPLEQYGQGGYAYSSDGEEYTKALDAAVALTASGWGPPFATRCNDADGEWWYEGYTCACHAVEWAIANALTAEPGGEQA
jgi:hypothetical protein